ncbi:Uma2 family endonuclease [Actinomadura yumaensis]|uniref:Uma2 family endonuclease n=1 Tax=Actinomadura yumaensis TaxID=111807 RepID=UPI0036079DCF
MGPVALPGRPLQVHHASPQVLTPRLRSATGSPVLGTLRTHVPYDDPETDREGKATESANRRDTAACRRTAGHAVRPVGERRAARLPAPPPRRNPRRGHRRKSRRVPTPGVPHGGIVQDVADAVSAARSADPEFAWRTLQVTGIDYLGTGDGYIPDLIVLAAEALDRAREADLPKLAPDEIELVVEVTSKRGAENDLPPADRRTRTKWNWYAHAEIPYYLLVDRSPKAGRTTLYSIPDQGRRPTSTRRAGTSARPSGCRSRSASTSRPASGSPGRPDRGSGAPLKGAPGARRGPLRAVR